MLELHYPTVTKTILERQYPGKPTLKVAFGNGNGAIFENSSKLRVSLFVTSRWPRSSGQTNYQVHHPPLFKVIADKLPVSNDRRLKFIFFKDSYQICCVYVTMALHYYDFDFKLTSEAKFIQFF